MKQDIEIGTTDYTASILIRDTAGAVKTGLTFESAGLDVTYARVEIDNDVVVTAGAPVTTTLTGAHVDWGFVEVDATNHPGLYKLDIADGVFAAGAWSAVVTVIGTGLDPTHIEYILSGNTLDTIGSDVAAILVDTDTTIPGLITAASPSQHIPTANTENGNTTLDGGTFASVSTNDDATYYQTGPGVAVGGFGLNCVLTFGIGTGRVPSTLTVDGHFDSGAQRTVQVWAYDYILSAYVQLSNSATDFGNSATDRTQQYAMNPTMQNVTTGEVLVRFTSTSETITDVLEVDFCAVNSVAGAAAGLTADAIQAAVWARGHSGHDEETLGYVVGHTFLLQGNIVSATNSQRFVIDAGVATDDAYNGMVITLEDKTDDHYESRVIQDYDGGTKEIYVDRIFSFTPEAGDDYYILNGTGADSSYIITTLGNVNDVISNQVAITGAGFATGTDSLAVLSDLINTIDGVVATGLTLGQFMGLKK